MEVGGDFGGWVGGNDEPNNGSAQDVARRYGAGAYGHVDNLRTHPTYPPMPGCSGQCRQAGRQVKSKLLGNDTDARSTNDTAKADSERERALKLYMFESERICVKTIVTKRAGMNDG